MRLTEMQHQSNLLLNIDVLLSIIQSGKVLNLGKRGYPLLPERMRVRNETEGHAQFTF